MDVLKALSEIGVVPVIKLTDVSKAEKLAEALVAGGVPCAEVTFRAAGADEAIRRMRAACPELLVGAGTVLKVEQAEAALDAGAQFLVSPGTNPEVVRYTQSRGSIIIPGVMAPTEIEQALSLGLTTVKFFPAGQAGGVPMLKALSAPYSGVKFVPTGGVDLKNLASYLELPCVAAVGGTFMVTSALLDADDFDGITALCRAASVIVKTSRK